MKPVFPHGPKSDWINQANAIISGEVKLSSADISMLMKWLQDMNWPGAPEIAVYLRSFGEELIDPMAVVLKSNDSIWIYWVLTAFSDVFGLKFWTQLKNELCQIAFKWDPEGAHIISLYLLAKYKLATVDSIKIQIEAMKKNPEANGDDYRSIENELHKNGSTKRAPCQ